ncbi:MAG: glutathionylspermidine synthase family protein [Deltaproteobacteria bacterium]|nr:glutathionylspermidine synthase family protein [Deltaproteobacteria bacterium]
MSFCELRLLDRPEPLDDERLSTELVERHLVFDAFVGGARRVDLHPLVLSREAHRAAVVAAESAWRDVSAIAAEAFADERESARYGFADDVVTLARASHGAGDGASLVRVDLLLDEHARFVACEVNADCPGGHNEADGLPDLARRAGFRGGVSPSRVVDALADRLGELAVRPNGSPGAVGLLYATAYAEDLQPCALIARALKKRGVTAILAPPTAPYEEGDGLAIGGVPIDALYRFFPTEYMEGQRNVAAIARAIASGRVRTLSSFSQMYGQSKLAFARASAAGVSGHLPYSASVEAIDPREVSAARAEWVLKRALGRVGEQVFVGALFSDDDWRTVVREVVAARDAGERWIAQRYVRQRRLASPWGDRYLTLGAYLLDGRFCGYFARLTPQTHASHDALCVPVFVRVD